MPSPIQIKSYAKINWTLEVLFKREDGYHELRTIYQTVSLHDQLRITATDGPIEIVCDDTRVPCDETNLAFKAAALLMPRLPFWGWLSCGRSRSKNENSLISPLRLDRMCPSF